MRVSFHPLINAPLTEVVILRKARFYASISRAAKKYGLNVHSTTQYFLVRETFGSCSRTAPISASPTDFHCMQRFFGCLAAGANWGAPFGVTQKFYNSKKHGDASTAFNQEVVWVWVDGICERARFCDSLSTGCTARFLLSGATARCLSYSLLIRTICKQRMASSEPRETSRVRFKIQSDTKSAKRTSAGYPRPYHRCL